MRLRSMAATGLWLMLASWAHAVDMEILTIHANNDAGLQELRRLVTEMTSRYGDSLGSARDITLIGAYDAVTLQHTHSEGRTMMGSYARAVLAGFQEQMIVSGPAVDLQPGRYLVVYRLQELLHMPSAPFYTMQVRSHGKVIAGRGLDPDSVTAGSWMAIPAGFDLSDASSVECSFCASQHPVALDRIYVLQLRDAPAAPAKPAAPAAPARPAAAPKAAEAPPIPIELEVPSSAAGVPAATGAPAVAGKQSAIERPEFRDKPKALVKSLTSITAMAVRTSPDGETMGYSCDLIAAVDRDSRRLGRAGIGMVYDDGDQMMKTTLEEALRAVRLRYPLWEPGHIGLSFGEKFAAHGGPSAGTAFAILMLSTLEGFDIDPKCAITGDISVDWKVRKVGAVTAKIRGATLDKCLYAAIPVDNETAFADMALLYGDSALWDIQVFSLATLQDAIALARRDRAPQVAQAMQLFADLQPQLAQAGKRTLQDPRTRQQLKHILELAPNHLSAKYLLAVGDGSAAKTLSGNGTMYRLSVISYPFQTLLQSQETINRQTLPIATTVLARKRLAGLRPIADKSLLPLLGDIAAAIEAMDGLAGNTTSAAVVNTRIANLNARLAGLKSDLGFSERLVHEGY